MNALDSFLWRLNIEHDDKDKPALAQQYEKLASKFNELYLAGKERSREAMALALEKANEKMTAMGAFSVERGEKLKHYLTRDLDQTLADAQHRGEGAKSGLTRAAWVPARFLPWLQHWTQPAMRCIPALS